MFTVSIARTKCYLILQGLERSLGETITRYLDYTNESFLSTDEQRRTLTRLREDLGDRNWTLDDVKPIDLVHYLDLGDLVQLLNRHSKLVRNANPKHVTATTELITEKGIIGIRKRVMHPIRPLEPDDLPILLELAKTLPQIAPSLIWSNLVESWQIVCEKETIPNITIPHDWREESLITHNLPSAEFDDTGFIGRQKERKDLKQLLLTDQKVITVVGEGGKGKTALVLRVCNDLLDDTNPPFDRIVWVSLKTKILTSEGIRQISDAVDSVGALVKILFRHYQAPLLVNDISNWHPVIEQMKKVKTLLVIDNLETIGNEIRELLLSIPFGSKVLMTSRVGFGELEVRYELPPLAPKDAVHLFRILSVIYNYTSLKSLNQNIVSSYCEKLGHNPLLIKWFVLAAGKGVDPSTLLSKQGKDEALKFCYSNIYDRLGPLAKSILSILLGARRELTKTQLQELTASEHVSFMMARQELLCSSMVNSKIGDDGTEIFQVSGLVYEYLSNNYPPNASTVSQIRNKIRKWQLEQDRSGVGTAAYRYDPKVLFIETIDQQISAQYLRNALRLASQGDFTSSHVELTRAIQLTPSWWEVYRVQARILEQQFRPVYDVEEAYETSIRCQSNDINLYHYANYLIHQNEFERAVNKIDLAISCEDCLQAVLRGMKGLALMWWGKTSDAIPELEFAWNDDSKVYPLQVKKSQGTQFAEVYRRSGEQLFSLGRGTEALDSLCKSMEIIDEIINQYSLDIKIVDTILNLVFTTIKHNYFIENDVNFKYGLVSFAFNYDSNNDFINISLNNQQTIKYFEMTNDLKFWFPKTYEALQKAQLMKYYYGTIKTIKYDENFGFIHCTETGDSHFNVQSLIDPSQWENIKPGDSVSFRLIPEGKGKSPHALNMRFMSKQIDNKTNFNK